MLLLIVSISLTIQSHSFHRSRVISSANFVTGNVYEQLNVINEYFSLRKQNEILANENARLKSILFNKKDSLKSIETESILGVKSVNLILSKVIKNTYNTPENYLTINSGTAQGVASEMAVINDLGVIGIVANTSKNFATVTSILNVSQKFNVKLKNSNHFGTLNWNGKNTGFVQLTEMPRLATLRKGDTIVTGNDSQIFPPDINIGTIHKIQTDDETNFFTIQVKLFNDMTNLGTVYILKTRAREEIIELEKATNKDE